MEDSLIVMVMVMIRSITITMTLTIMVMVMEGSITTITTGDSLTDIAVRSGALITIRTLMVAIIPTLSMIGKARHTEEEKDQVPCQPDGAAAMFLRQVVLHQEQIVLHQEEARMLQLELHIRVGQAPELRPFQLIQEGQPPLFRNLSGLLPAQRKKQLRKLLNQAAKVSLEHSHAELHLLPVLNIIL
jgi:hypothetical protein